MKSTNDMKEFKSKNVTDLTKLSTSKKDELVKTLLDVQFGKDKNVAKLNKLKKDIARIETIINESVTAHAIKQGKARKND